MFALPLALSIDSLLAACVLSAAVPARHFARLVALFGACDMAGSALAPVLSAHSMAAGIILPALPVLWGTLVLGARKEAAMARISGRAVYLLPVLFAADNLLAPGVTPWLAGAVSAAMAAGGFALGAVTLRRLVLPAHQRRWLGASFVACGLLLAF
jgi:hypothetical protein